MAGRGKAEAMALITDEGYATLPTAGSIATDSLDGLLTAMQNWKVANVGGQWFIDVSPLARTAIDAGLAARVGDDGRTLLKLTAAGRAMVTRIHANRLLAQARQSTQDYRRGKADALALARPQTLRRWRNTAALVAFGLGMFTAGTATAVLAMQV